MDPNETLQKIRELLYFAENAVTLAGANTYREQACNHFRDLDDWLTNGGFSPSDWIGS